MGRSATTRLDWFPLYATDFYESDHVAALSKGSEAAYMRLLKRQWDVGHIPADMVAILDILPRKFDAEDVAPVLPRFPVDVFNPSTRVNARMASVRVEQRALAEQTSARRAEAGKRSGEARRLKSGLPSNKCSTLVEQTPNKIEQKKKENKNLLLEKEAKGAPRTAKAVYAEIVAGLPLSHKSIELADAIADYLKLRTEKRMGQWQASTVEKRVAEWAAVTPGDLLAAFKSATVNEYRGVFVKVTKPSLSVVEGSRGDRMVAALTDSVEVAS